MNIINAQVEVLKEALNRKSIVYIYEVGVMVGFLLPVVNVK